jgi:hypothetical protein
LATAGASPLATSIGSGAPPAAPWVSGARPSMDTASGIALPSASALVNNKTWISHPWRLRLLLEATCSCAVYSPSTTLASSNAASTAGASDSA